MNMAEISPPSNVTGPEEICSSHAGNAPILTLAMTPREIPHSKLTEDSEGSGVDSIILVVRRQLIPLSHVRETYWIHMVNQSSGELKSPTAWHVKAEPFNNTYAANS